MAMFIPAATALFPQTLTVTNALLTVAGGPAALALTTANTTLTAINVLLAAGGAVIFTGKVAYYGSKLVYKVVKVPVSYAAGAIAHRIEKPAEKKELTMDGWLEDAETFDDLNAPTLKLTGETEVVTADTLTDEKIRALLLSGKTVVILPRKSSEAVA